MALAQCLLMAHSDMGSQGHFSVHSHVLCVRWHSSSAICYSTATAPSWQQEGVPLGRENVCTSFPVPWTILQTTGS